MKALTCILCPRGCPLLVDETQGYAVTGNACPRGVQYGQSEVAHPVRVLTTTVATTSALHPRLPVKTSAPLPKAALPEAMRAIAGLKVDLPIAMGSVLVSHFLGYEVDLIATRSLTDTPSS